MKNLFKKKKSDTKLAPQPMQYEPVAKKAIIMVETPLQAPPLMMPKPKRALTPTRAILGRFDNDKTEVEDSPLQDISPILLPTAHHDPPLPPPMKSLQQQLSTLSVTGSDDSSRIYESAVESPSTTRSNSRQEVIDLPEFPPSAALAQKQQQQQQQQQSQQSQQQQESDMKKKFEEQQEFKRQQESMRQQQERERQELIIQQQELERQQELKRKQELEKNQDLLRQQEFEKQQELKIQQQESERKEYIERQKQLELEHLKTQMQKQKQFQEHQYHENQSQQQKHQFQQHQLQQQINTQSGISDASSRTASPGQRHYAQRSSASSATATPMVKGTTPQASEEQEILFELKRQLEKMERQRARDREEWRRKEAELMIHSNQMMEKLKETEGQLSMALKHEDDIRQRQQQQQQQQQQERVPYRSRSEEQIKHKRSASRSSYHHLEDNNKKPPFNDGYLPKHTQEYTEEFIEEYPQEYPEDYYPEYPKESLSRRSSNASHRSRRARSKSIEARRMDLPSEEDTMFYSRPHPRRSRSAGRSSVKSPAASMYYDDLYKDDPRYYSQVVPANEQAQYYNVRNDSVLDNRGYYRPYSYHTNYYSQHQPQYHPLRPTMVPSRSTQSIGYSGYYFR